MTAIKLRVDGEEFSDWLSYDIESDIIQPADAFSFSAPNIGGAMAGKIYPGDSFQLTVDNVQVMTGLIDDVHYTTQGREGARVELIGRDMFGQLVDVSAEPKTYKNIKLDTLAFILAAEWVPLWTTTTGINLQVHKWVKVEPGESVWDVLSRLAKKDRVLLWLTPLGIGTIGRPDYTQAATHSVRMYKPGTMAVNQTNALDQDVTHSMRDRYSVVQFAGSSGNTVGKWGTAALIRQGVRVSFTAAAVAAAIKTGSMPRATVAPGTDFSVTDPEVINNRRLFISDEDIKSLSQAQQRARDEIERRAFEGDTYSYTVRGHYGDPAIPGGVKKLFEPDQRVALIDEMADLSGTFYLSKRRFTMDADQGAKTSLELHLNGWMGS